MKYKSLIFGISIFALTITSCVKDLDVKPIDSNIVLASGLTADQYKQVLAKIYASFIIGGQGGDDSKGTGVDITGTDANFGSTMRAYWNCQELTTDEAICSWGDAGISDFNTQNWSATNPFLTALYDRLVLSVTYANDFIRVTNGNTDPTIKRYNAEARFLRAMAYSYAMDCFANPPFTTEADQVGKFYPKQIQRPALYKYVVNELRSVSSQLGEPGFSYANADKGACWMLLARLYLNAAVYTADPITQTGGTAKWDSCKMYCDSVISCGKYALATNYRRNFSADNDYQSGNKEMIFSWAMDGKYTQGYLGTTFIISSSSDGTYINAIDSLGMGSTNTNWGGNRSKKQFINVLIDTLATYGNVSVPTSDVYFRQCKDTRVFARQLAHWDITSASSAFPYGIGIFKFTNLKSDKTQADDWNSAYSSTDFPVFRLADAYLMRAEALYNLNASDPTALADINYVRDRAFHAGEFGSNTPNRLTSLTAQAILDERGREFYYEAQRRTDLIRFGQFTNGTYNWAWKGGVFNGTATDKHLNIFPIPGNEVSTNTNIKQNAGY
jgi:starch-binding outer membrane protein, SusD/RagB family